MRIWVCAGTCLHGGALALSFYIFSVKEKIRDLTFSVRKEPITENYFNVA